MDALVRANVLDDGVLLGWADVKDVGLVRLRHTARIRPPDQRTVTAW
jgi:hypothetical protein